jgi:hypothetical protein
MDLLDLHCSPDSPSLPLLFLVGPREATSILSPKKCVCRSSFPVLALGKEREGGRFGDGIVGANGGRKGKTKLAEKGRAIVVATRRLVSGYTIGRLIGRVHNLGKRPRSLLDRVM